MDGGAWQVTAKALGMSKSCVMGDPWMGCMGEKGDPWMGCMGVKGDPWMGLYG